MELTPLHVPSTADFSGGVVDRDLLDRALRTLEPGWRAVVVLHYFLGMPCRTSRPALGIPLGTAKSRLHRSLGVLRTTVAERRRGDQVAVPEGRFA